MAEFKTVPTFDMVIVGGTGDLSMRKLLPALYHRHCDEQLPQASRIIAVSREAVTDEAFAEQVLAACKSSPPPGAWDDACWAQFRERLHYLDFDATDSNDYAKLTSSLNEHQDRIRVFYLATPPKIFVPIAAAIGRAGLVTEFARLVLEKPVGHDLNSAHAINRGVGEVFEESATFRIDHYLGKETVQNLAALRFGNSLFEPLWNSGHIDHVQLTVAETLGVGNRAEFYDGTGALRDMVQNHMLQLLCLTAMEVPSSLHADEMRDAKLRVLSALRPFDATSVVQSTVRGQYAAGAVGGEAVAGYIDDIGGASSDTETFVALKTYIDTWRWGGTPFYLRTGKRLAARYSEIVVQFKSVPHNIFGTPGQRFEANRLVLRLQPDEGVKLTMMIKQPGPGGFVLQPQALNLSYADTFKVRYPDAYERLLMEVIRGNPALFMRRDEVESAWRWTESVSDSWTSSGQAVEPYQAGGQGPLGAAILLDRDGRKWFDSQ